MLSISREVDVNPLGPVQLHVPPVAGCGARFTTEPGHTFSEAVKSQEPPAPTWI